MAKTLVRPSLYDEDFLAWTEHQAALLRARRLDQLDLDSLAEELDTMGRSEWGELENRLEVLLMHLLKWDFQPARRSSPATFPDQLPYSVAEVLEPAPEAQASPPPRRRGR